MNGNHKPPVLTSHKLKVNEELLRQYFAEEWAKLFGDPNLLMRHTAATPVIDVLKDEAKHVIEKVLKRFRP
jgi:hypothetical protein